MCGVQPICGRAPVQRLDESLQQLRDEYRRVTRTTLASGWDSPGGVSVRLPGRRVPSSTSRTASSNRCRRCPHGSWCGSGRRCRHPRG